MAAKLIGNLVCARAGGGGLTEISCAGLRWQDGKFTPWNFSETVKNVPRYFGVFNGNAERPGAFYNHYKNVGSPAGALARGADEFAAGRGWLSTLHHHTEYDRRVQFLHSQVRGRVARTRGSVGCFRTCRSRAWCLSPSLLRVSPTCNVTTPFPHAGCASSSTTYRIDLVRAGGVYRVKPGDWSVPVIDDHEMLQRLLSQPIAKGIYIDAPLSVFDGAQRGLPPK